MTFMWKGRGGGKNVSCLYLFSTGIYKKVEFSFRYLIFLSFIADKRGYDCLLREWGHMMSRQRRRQCQRLIGGNLIGDWDLSSECDTCTAIAVQRRRRLRSGIFVL